MADKTTIARPYAKAAFEEARGIKSLGPWSDALNAAAAVVTDPRVATLIGNPRVKSTDLAQLVIDIAGPQIGEHGANFVRTLAENHRLAYLPEISVLFTDINMPGQFDGLELARLVHEYRPDIRLILTSGRSPPAASEIPDAGRFLSKPYDQASLAKLVAA